MKPAKWFVTSLFMFSTIGAAPTMGDTAIPQDYLALPVLISLEKAGSASGFFMNSEAHVYLVTATHVLFDGPSPRPREARATLSCWTKDTVHPERVVLRLDLNRLVDNGLVFRSARGDVTVVRFAQRSTDPNSPTITTNRSHVQWLRQSGTQIQGANARNTKRFDEVFVSNDVYLFGYPSSLGIEEIPQLDYARPLLRKGVIAGKNPALRTIIIDCPSYYGNSGGPVVQVERRDLLSTEFKIIGIVSQFVPFKETWVNTTHKTSHWEISNSGYSVVTPIDSVLELIEEHEAKRESPERSE